MNKLSRLAALLLTLLMLLSCAASAETGSDGIAIEDLDTATYQLLLSEAAETSEEGAGEETYPEPLVQCTDSIYGKECLLDELRTMTAEERCAAVNAKESYYYSHYRTYHEETELLCECDFPMPAPGAEGHIFDNCPWHPDNYVPEVDTDLGDIETDGICVTGDIPAGTEISVTTPDMTDIDVFEQGLKGMMNAYTAIDVTLTDASGEEWQPESGKTLSVTMDVSGIGKAGDRVNVYHVHGEPGAQTLQIIEAGTIDDDGNVSFSVNNFSYLLAVNMSVDGGTVSAPAEPIVPDLPEQPALGNGVYTYASAGSADLSSGAATIDLPKSGKATLSVAESGGQWQVLVGEQWVDVTGETGATFEVTYATIAMLGSGAQIRWISADGETTSETATINVVESVQTAAEEELMYAPMLLSSGADVMAAADEPTEGKYSVVVNYVFQDGSTAYDPWTASLAAGSDFSATINFPSVVGYLPYLGEATESTTSLALNIENIQSDITHTVTYKPTNVDYTVKHYQQNVADDNYTLVKTETLQGLTNSDVPDVANTYAGFYALLYEKPAIAADGLTVVEVYYDRNYYLMNFDLGGGYGVDPIYDRYGATIADVGTPVRAGYTFQGWSLDGTNIVDLPTTMPAENRMYTAVWQMNDTAKVTVVFWGENANDEEYSYYKTGTLDVPLNQDGETIFTYDDDDTRFIICGQTEHTHDDSCEPTLECETEEHTHSGECCTVDTTHTHTTSCYNNVNTNQNVSNEDRVGAPSNPVDGQIYRRGNWYNRLIYINGTWYRYGGNAQSGTVIDPNNSCPGVHTHGDGDCNCTQEEHTHDEDCYSYSCGLTEHTHVEACYQNGSGMDGDLWTFVKSDTVTVNPDGSSVVNVYYDRVEFTFTFRTGSSSNSTIHSFDAKWGSDISDKWTFTGSNGVSYPTDSTSWTPTNSDTYTQRITMMVIMPAESIIFRHTTSSNASRTFHYYVESLEQTDGDNKRWFENKWYDWEFDLVNDFNQLYYDEDFFELEGFTRYKSAREDDSEYPIGNGTSPIDNLYFYYTRNVYDIEFYNPTELLKTENDVPFEAPLGKYDFTPTANQAPAQYEPGSVVFDGWYLNPECTGDEYILSEHTMPLGTENGETSLSLYAKWVPVDRTVEFYLDKAAYDAGEKLASHPDVTVPHGSLIDPTPADPTNGDYDFVGWFYVNEDGKETAINFEGMQIRKDLKVYGKWSSKVLKEYTIYYKIQGTDTQIAEPTTGSALAGITKTFDAKGGTDLYTDYQTGYFPTVQSHSLTLDIENDDNNVFTFWYVQKNAVPYMVYYVTEEDPGMGLGTVVIDGTTYYLVADTETFPDNRKAVVTETFKPVSGYMPDAYQKRLVVTGDASEGVEWITVTTEDGTAVQVHPDNVITFVYTVDTAHAYYKVTHYTQNLDGVNWTEYQSLTAQGDIGTPYTGTPLTIPGFTYSEIEYNKADGTPVEESMITDQGAKLTGDGLEINLYYTRNSYPYQVRYLEYGTEKVLADPKTGEGLYGEVISESAIDIANYTALDPTSQTLNIRIEDGDTPEKNIITFYYTENDATINYVVVGPDGCGKVTPDTETVKVVTGDAIGSTAAASSSDYKFVGWYSDPECKTLVSPDAEFVPTQPGRTTAEDGSVKYGLWPETTTYYAKFEWNVTSLTITKQGLDLTLDPNASTMFSIEGANDFSMTVVVKGNSSVTINNLLVGTYTVTELTDWSWRYTADKTSATVEAEGGQTNSVTFTNTRETDQWLDDEASAENVFTGVTTE